MKKRVLRLFSLILYLLCVCTILSWKIETEQMALIQYESRVTEESRTSTDVRIGAIFTDLSVFDNVAFPMREQTNLDEETIRDLVLLKLNAVGLRGAAELMPSEVSGGMSRRVALARAIALDPALILYDEPFAGLDPISMGVTAKLIRSLSDSLHATSIVVTHDVAETFEIADYVYMISSGVVAAEGTPDELRSSTDPFVTQFIRGESDGPVRFHYPSPDLRVDFLGEKSA